MSNVIVYNSEDTDRPDEISLDAWNLHCNRLEQGKESDVFECQDIVEYMAQWGIAEDWREGVIKETTRTENSRLDEFLAVHGSTDITTNFYESPPPNNKASQEYQGVDTGKLKFLLLCIFGVLLSIVIRGLIR